MDGMRNPFFSYSAGCAILRKRNAGPPAPVGRMCMKKLLVYMKTYVLESILGPLFKLL